MALRNYVAGKELISTSLGRGVQKEYKRLQNIVAETKQMLVDLERRNLLGEEVETVRKLKEIKKLYYEADDVLDEFSYEAMRIQNCMTTRKVSISPLLFHCRMSLKIKDFHGVLLTLKQGMKFPSDSGMVESHGISEISPPTIVGIDYASQVYRGHMEVYGRAEEKENIVNMLVDPKNEEMLSVISIVGLGGLGKTTLAKLIFNEESIKSHFDLRFWVTVSMEFDVKRIVKEIIDQSPGIRSMGDLTSWDKLQHLLEEILSGKRFFLVLDDVWSEDYEKWDNFRNLLKVGSKGSKIIVTTRNVGAASIMGSHYVHRLQVQSKDVGWALFESKAFGSRDAVWTQPDILEIGRKIVETCGGLPLMTRVLGGMMHYKKNIEEWKTVLDVITKRSWNGVSSALNMSYNDMESPLKRCFSYCLLFPANYVIERKKMIQLWMAEGFLEEATATNGVAMEDIGYAYFNSLVMRSFLDAIRVHDNGEAFVYTMHDLVRDFAWNSLGDEVMTVVEYRNVVEIKPETRYLSLFVPSDKEPIPDKFFTKMNKVRTFLDGANNISSHGPLLLKFSKSLRVLELGHVDKDELPSSIGELIHLRYLDLSHGKFKALPESISKLYHLQNLKLLHCRYLQRLPKGMRKLINLRHLEIERRLDIPRGLGQLSNLQTFTLFKLGNSVTEAGIEELRCLNQLGGRLSLIDLNHVKNGEDAKSANLKEKRRLQELTLEWESDWHVCTEDDSRKQDVVLEELQPHQNLLLLRIIRFSGTMFPTWLNNGSSHLSNLRELCIYSCHHVKSLDMTRLKSLRKLMISYCENLEYAGLEGLMHLELLEFKGCEKLKSLGAENGVANQEEAQQVYQVGSSREAPAITEDTVYCPKLWIQSCDRLTSLPGKLLQSLKTLYIGNCANRKVLTEGLENLSSLKHLQIESCPNLKEFPEGLGQLSYLKYFAIRECPKLMFLTEEMRCWRWLQSLSIVGCANLRTLPRGIKELTTLQELEISGCNLLVSFPDEMQNMKSLQTLKIERCSTLMALPAVLGNLSSLEVLEISSCNSLMSLPGGMQQLTKLDSLKIQGCDNLILPEEFGIPSTLRVLAIIGCPNLEVLPEGLGNLQNLRLLEITDCSNLTVLPERLGELSSLGSLYIQRCCNLTSIPNTLPCMSSLRVLWLIECPKLKYLSSGLKYLSSLEKLTVWGCHSLIELLPEGIQDLNSLEELIISHCLKLETLPKGLENLKSLKELVIWKCPKLRSSKNVIQQLKGRKLKKLNIKDCPNLETIDDESSLILQSTGTVPE